MFSLLAAHFVGVDRTTFDRDLEDKSCAILLEDEAGDVRGFSTMVVYESCASGTPISVVYSGDTIVDRAWWGSPALARTWVRAVRQLAPASEPRDVYWLLLTSDSELTASCRYSSVNSTRASTRPTPPRDASLLDALARERFGQHYDAASGVVRFDAARRFWRRISITLPAGRVPDPHVAFFLERNPGFVRRGRAGVPDAD